MSRGPSLGVLVLLHSLPSNGVTSDGGVTSDTRYYFILRLKYRKSKNFKFKKNLVTIGLFLVYNFNTFPISIDNWLAQQEGICQLLRIKKVYVCINFVKIFQMIKSWKALQICNDGTFVDMSEHQTLFYAVVSKKGHFLKKNNIFFLHLFPWIFFC